MSATRFYVGTGLARKDEARAVAAMLKTEGWIQTYDWTVHGSAQGGPERWPAVAAAEIAGVADADVVLILLPGGRGTHVELGAALALRKPVVLVASADDMHVPVPMLGSSAGNCVFHFHKSVQRVEPGDHEGIVFAARRVLRRAALRHA